MVGRMSPAQPPLAADIQARLDRIMPKGTPPLILFTSLARDKRLFERFMAGGLLDSGWLTLRQREIVIDRTTALSRSEYEWGIHVAFFAARAGLTATQIKATTTEKGDDSTWTDDDRVLIRACDQLHRTCDLDDGTWRDLRTHFSDEAILEVLMLAGYYRTVSYLTNALRLPLETYGARFPE
jgi:alkylhydroperoxidase family enzyme